MYVFQNFTYKFKRFLYASTPLFSICVYVFECLVKCVYMLHLHNDFTVYMRVS